MTMDLSEFEDQIWSYIFYSSIVIGNKSELAVGKEPIVNLANMKMIYKCGIVAMLPRLSFMNLIDLFHREEKLHQ